MNYKTLIILDWDDTLFPTSWFVKNKKNLMESDNNFPNLDLLLNDILSNLRKYGQVAIVTNATAKWIIATSDILPKTQTLLKNNDIFVISARDIEQGTYPKNIDMWKKKVFEKLVGQYFMGYNLQNIISIGDAEYEYDALVDLYQKNAIEKGRILKTVKFLKDPSFDQLFDQLQVLNKCINKIITGPDHMDIKFNVN